jgi:DNA-binding transcriptional LysR family regulator
MLDVRRLLLLRELRDRKTIAAVADALSYTPSAVSQQLAQLQREAGVELIERVGRGVRLTDAGRTLASHADAIIERLEAADADLEAAGGRLRGTVKVTSYQTAARALVVPAITTLGTRHPEIRLEMAEFEAEQALPMLRTGDADIVIAEEYPFAPRRRDPALERHPLGVDTMLLALAPTHPLARSEGPIHLRDLADEAWATSRPGTLFAEALVRACRSLGGFEPDLRHRANDIGGLLQLAADGHAVAMIPAIGVAVRPEGVAIREVAGRGHTRDVFAAVRRGTHERPVIAAVLEVLRHHAREIGLLDSSGPRAR